MIQWFSVQLPNLSYRTRVPNITPVYSYETLEADATTTRKRVLELQPFGWQLKVFARINEAFSSACESAGGRSIKARHPHVQLTNNG